MLRRNYKELFAIAASMLLHLEGLSIARGLVSRVYF